jgi:hypothetical protein
MTRRADTEGGKALRLDLAPLEKLLRAYQEGALLEHCNLL